MSDTRLRDLERRCKSTGSVEDEAAYLLERVRAGDLTRERLELAAFCGHEGAARALDQPVARKSLAEWLDGLEAFGRVVVVAAAVAVARQVLPIWNDAHPEDGRPRAAVEAAAGWLACVCADCAEHAVSAALASNAAAKEPPAGRDTTALQAVRCVRSVCATAAFLTAAPARRVAILNVEQRGTTLPHQRAAVVRQSLSSAGSLAGEIVAVAQAHGDLKTAGKGKLAAEIAIHEAVGTDLIRWSLAPGGSST